MHFHTRSEQTYSFMAYCYDINKYFYALQAALPITAKSNGGKIVLIELSGFTDPIDMSNSEHVAVVNKLMCKIVEKLQIRLELLIDENGGWCGNIK